jgi:hypothetical protein
VVTKYVGRASAAGLDWATVQTLSDTALERRVVPGRPDRLTRYVLPEYRVGGRSSTDPEAGISSTHGRALEIIARTGASK